MKEYSVTWKIDLSATSPRKAAEEALKIQRDPGSTSTVFEVREEGKKKVVMIDLEEGLIAGR